jgi:hypothetical protein
VTQFEKPDYAARVDSSGAYVWGFLDGQARAYCEQVRLGSRLAGAINCHQEHAERLRLLIAQEGCRVLVIPAEADRVSVWIYRYEFLEAIIGRLSDQDTPGPFHVWAMGKLFGYADSEIAAYVGRIGGAVAT